jgi:putative redox protein
MNQVQLNFNNQFSGELLGKAGSVHIGEGEMAFKPYELLAGALGSCLYSTFLDIVKKMRLEFQSCTLDIEWEKRTETPTTCKWILIKSKFIGIDSLKKDRYTKAFELATEYCSVFSTLSHVAEIKWELYFE